MSISSAVDEWIRIGLPVSKITIGLPFYARAWAIPRASASASLSSFLYAPGSMPPNPVDSIVAYSSVPRRNLDVGFDEVAGAAWGVDRGGGRFYSFDNERSVHAKVAWGKSKGVEEGPLSVARSHRKPPSTMRWPPSDLALQRLEDQDQQQRAQSA
ncbi:hypothetical protein HK097_004880 [Rhizophlyctis rosea]|uniref:GH18 domain-containing protein n=1 Tax=Rhizophlyctis rosea TaxID=64517 RepID=A0AAD5X5Q7_9FUNG|nr:hypothetical protein HK097_004880 [Rhizophlyctis rosea]